MACRGTSRGKGNASRASYFIIFPVHNFSPSFWLLSPGLPPALPYSLSVWSCNEEYLGFKRQWSCSVWLPAPEQAVRPLTFLLASPGLTHNHLSQSQPSEEVPTDIQDTPPAPYPGQNPSSPTSEHERGRTNFFQLLPVVFLSMYMSTWMENPTNTQQTMSSGTWCHTHLVTLQENTPRLHHSSSCSTACGTF